MQHHLNAISWGDFSLYNTVMKLIFSFLVTATARTNLTPSHVSVVVFQVRNMYQ